MAKNMNIKSKNFTQKEIIAVIKFNGFVFIRNNGSSHEIWGRGKERMSIVNGGSKKHSMNSMIFLRLIKEYNLDLSVLK